MRKKPTLAHSCRAYYFQRQIPVKNSFAFSSKGGKDPSDRSRLSLTNTHQVPATLILSEIPLLHVCACSGSRPLRHPLLSGCRSLSSASNSVKVGFPRSFTFLRVIMFSASRLCKGRYLVIVYFFAGGHLFSAPFPDMIVTCQIKPS